jgi:uncharacterized membrane protein YuzA (DUF378 family)
MKVLTRVTYRIIGTAAAYVPRGWTPIGALWKEIHARETPWKTKP